MIQAAAVDAGHADMDRIVRPKNLSRTFGSCDGKRGGDERQRHDGGGGLCQESTAILTRHREDLLRKLKVLPGLGAGRGEL